MKSPCTNPIHTEPFEFVAIKKAKEILVSGTTTQEPAEILVPVTLILGESLDDARATFLREFCGQIDKKLWKLKEVEVFGRPFGDGCEDED